MDYYYEKRRELARDFIGVRHVQAVLLCAVLAVNYIQLGNAGITIATMTTEESEGNLKAFNWNKESSYFFSRSGFGIVTVSTLFGGYLSNKLNVKILLLISITMSTILTYITPMLVNYNYSTGFTVCRTIQGAFQGMVTPMVYSQMVRWLPPDELMITGPVILSGKYIGYSFITMMGGYLGIGQGGWPSIFYFSGNCGLLWILAYIGLGSYSPNYCFYISNIERRFIENSLPVAIRKPYRTGYPLMSIFKNMPLYALILSHSVNNWAFQVFIKVLPAICKERLQFKVTTTGILIGLPYFLFFLTVLGTHLVLKLLKKKIKLKHSVVRYIGFGIGHFGAFYCFMINSFSNNLTLTIFLHIIGLMLSSFQMYGPCMNYFDLAPNYVAFIFGIGSAFATIPSSLGPYLTALIFQYYPNERTMEALQMMYYSMAMLHLITGIIWHIFGSTKVQPMNDIAEKLEREKIIYEEGGIKTS